MVIKLTIFVDLFTNVNEHALNYVVEYRMLDFLCVRFLVVNANKFW